MLAEGSSPPPQELDAEDNSGRSPSATGTTPQPTTAQPAVNSRKRKKAPAAHAASPAPSDPGSTNGDPTALISSRADLSSRPILDISRGPIFVPAPDTTEYFKTDLIAPNRLGFRYMPAGINKPGHYQPCRTIESNPCSYRFSWEDRSPFLNVTKDGLGLRGGLGFRSARANAPFVEGKWYLEIKILHGGGEHVVDGRAEGSHVRVGWGRREAPLNGPAGLDGYSYGYRDKTGDKVALSRPRPYGRAFGSGDVIGMYISLPPKRVADKKDPLDPAHLKRERIPIDLKGQEVFEMLEYPQSKEMTALMDFSAKNNNSASVPSAPKKAGAGPGPERGGPSGSGKSNQPQLRPLPTLAGSRLAFFVNGECQGTAFSDIYDYLQLRQTDASKKGKEKKRAREGVKEHRENPFNDGTLGYYPFISLFNYAAVKLNPGPDFDHPPPLDIDAHLDGTKSEAQERTWRPACERYTEFMEEQWKLDELDEEEAKVEHTKYAAAEKAEAAKKAERAKKREQAAARKRAKLAASNLTPTPDLPSGGRSTPVSDSDEARASYTPGTRTPTIPFGHPSPSPLRHATTYEASSSTYSGLGVPIGVGSLRDQADDQASVDYNNSHYNSPAPTFVSEAQGGMSGYNTDNVDQDVEMEAEPQEEEEEGPEEEGIPVRSQAATPMFEGDTRSSPES